MARKSIYTKPIYGHKERKFTNLFTFVKSMAPFVRSHVLSVEDEVFFVLGFKPTADRDISWENL